MSNRREMSIERSSERGELGETGKAGGKLAKTRGEEDCTGV